MLASEDTHRLANNMRGARSTLPGTKQNTARDVAKNVTGHRDINTAVLGETAGADKAGSSQQENR